MSKRFVREDVLMWYQPQEMPKPEPPEGIVWAPPGPRNPWVDGLPLSAWLSWQMQSAGVPEEDPVPAALLEAIYAAENRGLSDREARHVFGAVESAVRHYTSMVRLTVELSEPR